MNLTYLYSAWSFRTLRSVSERAERSREEEPVEEIERRIERLKEEEKLAIEDLREAQREKEQLDEELKALELEEKELEEEEAEYEQVSMRIRLICEASLTVDSSSARFYGAM